MHLIKYINENNTDSFQDTVALVYIDENDNITPVIFRDGAFPVYDADIHSNAVNKFLYQPTATTTTISTASSENDYIISVADASSFVVGDSILINTGSVETTYPIIVSKNVNDITLDRRLDSAHSIGDTVTKVITDLSESVGSLASPQEYYSGPDAGEIWHIKNITISMGHTAAGDFGLFGGIAALTNGVLIRIRLNGVYETLTNWKTNGDINVDIGEVAFHSRSGGQGTNGTSANGAFKDRTGSIIRLNGDTNDRIEFYIQDDITGLAFWNTKIQGHIDN